MKSSYLKEVRELLSRNILTIPDVNALEKKSRKLELDFGTLVLSMFEQAKPGDVLSRIGLPVWRKLLTEIQDKLPSLDNRLVHCLLKSTKLDSTTVRSADIETWLELLSETQVVQAFSNLSPAKHAKEMATWVSQLTTKEPRGDWLLEVLQTLAPNLSKQTVPVLIGYNVRDMVFVDVGLIDCCLQLHIPFELADGYRVFSIRHWAAAAKGSRRVSSNLASTLAHPDYGPPRAGRTD
jgi:hypothetical protein